MPERKVVQPPRWARTRQAIRHALPAFKAEIRAARRGAGKGHDQRREQPPEESANTAGTSPLLCFESVPRQGNGQVELNSKQVKPGMALTCIIRVSFCKLSSKIKL